MRYPEISLIRCAPAAARVAKPVKCVWSPRSRRVPLGSKAFPDQLRRRKSRSMLPGFRFVLAAIVLSMSVLVFGLGAAALLRAAHEEFASTPAWRVAPEPKFARQNEPAREALGEEPMPVLAILRVEPEPAQPAATDSIPAAAAPAEPPAIAPMPDQPERIAALEPQDKTPPEAAKPDISAPEMSGQSEAPAVDSPAPVPAEETRIATAEQVLPSASEAGAPAPQQSVAPPAADTDIVATRIATLGGPPVAIEAPPPAKAAGAKPNPDAARKRQQARRAKERRRIALRARQAAAQQQAADPFAQPTITTRSR
ncbi:hypothetical protein [Bradyrhizobium sp.]|uniref:hypothetical protein n=1 Tax=Bradyrhizobium sp. TaxID=376 RepID=UPI002717EB97|nr:hypothetical protein [Bradyrhizobium sp.]MDO9295889.1 hypothetical protein [Bradyrhizobium sp.]